MRTRFANRIEAGKELAEYFLDLRNRRDVLVLALPRGGVPVAAEVARAINAPLDLLMVRKVGVPSRPELAMGAIASGDHLVLDERIIAEFGVQPDILQETIDREQEVLRQREQRYRGDRPAPDLRDKVVILVDDGLATGSSMRVAIQAAKRQRPAQVMVGVPVGSPDRIRMIEREVDRIECVHAPEEFMAVGQYYRNFLPTTDKEVIAALKG